MQLFYNAFKKNYGLLINSISLPSRRYLVGSYGAKIILGFIPIKVVVNAKFYL